MRTIDVGKLDAFFARRMRIHVQSRKEIPKTMKPKDREKAIIKIHARELELKRIRKFVREHEQFVDVTFEEASK